MEFLSLSRRRSSARNVLSDEERGETDVFAGYGDDKMHGFLQGPFFPLKVDNTISFPDVR